MATKCQALKRDTLSESDVYELELQLDNEVARKQRECRLLDRNRGQVGGNVSAKIAKQRKVLSIVKKEGRNVLIDLAVSTCSTRKKADVAVFRNLTRLLTEYDSVCDSISRRKTELSDMDVETGGVEKAIAEMTKKQITDTEWDRYVQEGQQTVATLENKLDTCMKQFCKILTENAKYRHEICRLSIERREFNKQWNRVVGNLSKGKTFMMDIVEQSTIAYNRRDEWCTKLDALRTKAHGDLVSHTQEMIALQRRIDHGKTLKEFVGTKTRNRVMSDLEQKEKAKKTVRIETMRETMQKYRRLLQQVADFIGSESGISDIIYKYVQFDEKIFSQFTYNCELGNEIKDLSDVLHASRADIDEQRSLRSRREDKQNESIDRLKRQVKLVTEENRAAKSALERTARNLQKTFDGITKLYEICKCSKAPVLELLGNNATVNCYNVSLHLNVLETEVHRSILTAYYKQENQHVQTKKGAPPPAKMIDDTKVPRSLYGIEEIVRSQPCPLCVDQEMVSDVIDELQFVRYRPQVTEQLSARLQLPDGLERIHNVSACHLPKSRQIIQRRYQ